MVGPLVAAPVFMEFRFRGEDTIPGAEIVYGPVYASDIGRIATSDPVARDPPFFLYEDFNIVEGHGDFRQSIE